VYVPAKKKLGGYIYLCDDCSLDTEEENSRYLGKMTEKSAEGIIIFRSDLESIKEQLELESRRGMSPNLNITSPVGELERQQKREHRAMEKETTIQDLLKEEKGGDASDQSDRENERITEKEKGEAE
jgi:hypothetical protein